MLTTSKWNLDFIPPIITHGPVYYIDNVEYRVPRLNTGGGQNVAAFIHTTPEAMVNGTMDVLTFGSDTFGNFAQKITSLYTAGDMYRSVNLTLDVATGTNEVRTRMMALQGELEQTCVDSARVVDTFQVDKGAIPVSQPAQQFNLFPDLSDRKKSPQRCTLTMRNTPGTIVVSKDDVPRNDLPLLVYIAGGADICQTTVHLFPSAADNSDHARR
ncbi:hypothetical protein GGF32_007204 [Allomyces javanicus]|nr:hypothetical protein GGF32_007204 [Allomyces javanicus]